VNAGASRRNRGPRRMPLSRNRIGNVRRLLDDGPRRRAGSFTSSGRSGRPSGGRVAVCSPSVASAASGPWSPGSKVHLSCASSRVPTRSGPRRHGSRVRSACVSSDQRIGTVSLTGKSRDSDGMTCETAEPGIPASGRRYGRSHRTTSRSGSGSLGRGPWAGRATSSRWPTRREVRARPADSGCRSPACAHRRARHGAPGPPRCRRPRHN
jgi:hypothetical protein